MSDWLDLQPDLLDWVGNDLRTHPVMATGRKGLTIDSVLRCALLKQYRQLSYDDLAFCLLDSMSCQSFARLTSGWLPKKSALQSVVSGISDVTWERINQRLLQCACNAKVEKGDMLRIDSTVTDAPIHVPSDSTLLWDSVRGNKGPLCQVDYSDGDEYLDLVCQFEDNSDSWSPGEGEATLTGSFNVVNGGGDFEGTDSICVVP